MSEIVLLHPNGIEHAVDSVLGIKSVVDAVLKNKIILCKKGILELNRVSQKRQGGLLKNSQGFQFSIPDIQMATNIKAKYIKSCATPLGAGKHEIFHYFGKCNIIDASLCFKLPSPLEPINFSTLSSVSNVDIIDPSMLFHHI